MPRTKDQASRNVGGNAKDSNKDSNADKQSASDRARASSAKKEPTPAPKPTPVAAPKPSYAVVASRPSTPAPTPRVVSTPAGSKTVSPIPSAGFTKPAPSQKYSPTGALKSYTNMLRNEVAPLPTQADLDRRYKESLTGGGAKNVRTAYAVPGIAATSKPATGRMVTPASAAALRAGASPSRPAPTPTVLKQLSASDAARRASMTPAQYAESLKSGPAAAPARAPAGTRTVSTPAGMKTVSTGKAPAASSFTPGEQGRIKAGAPVTSRMVSAGFTKAPVGSKLSATEALRVNNAIQDYASKMARGREQGAPPLTKSEILEGIGKPLFGPETTISETGEYYPAGGPLRIRVSPSEAPPPVEVSLYSPAEFAAMFPKPVVPAAPAPGVPVGGGGGSSSGGGLANLDRIAGGNVANIPRNTPAVGGTGSDARISTSTVPASTGTMAGGGGAPSAALSGSVGTGGGSASGSGSGGGQGSGGGLGGGLGGLAAGAASGAGQGTGAGAGEGAGSGTGSGTGAGAGAGAGVGAGTGAGGGAAGGEAGVAPPTGPSGCPPGYYLYTRPDGTTICVPETSGLPMIRPVVAPYYQPMGVGSLEGYVPYPGQT